MLKREPEVWSHTISVYIFYVAIAGAPLPLGSRDAITVAAWCGVLGVGLICASWKRLRGGHVAILGGIALLIAGYGVVLHEQLAVHPWIASYNPIWAKAADVLGRDMTPSVSIVRGEPFYALGAPLANILVLMLGLIVGADSVRARQSLLVVAWAGAAYAVYGVASFVIDPTMILWREKTAYVASVTGTFVNRNTAAAYFGSCATVWLLLLLRRIRGRLPKGPIEWRQAPRHILSDGGDNRGIVLRFVMMFACLAALLMTGSRAGVLTSLFVMVVAFVVFVRRDLTRGKNLVVAFVGAAIAALLILQILGGNVGYRIETEGLADAGRLSGWRSTMQIIGDHPWFGTGLGTFVWAFPAYRGRDIAMVGVWNAAHSTPLELASEVGLPLADAVALAWLIALAILVWGLRRSRRDAVAPLAALSVSLIGLLHSSVDFSLQVAGYAIVVFGLLGVGLAQSVVDSEPRQSAKPDEGRAEDDIGVSSARVGRSLVRLAILAFAGSALAWTAAVIPALRLERTVTDAATYKPEQLAAWDQLLNDKKDVLRPSAASRLAFLRFRRVESLLAAQDRQGMDAGFASLRQALDEALANTPSDPFLWLVLYWLESTHDKKQDLRGLKMSYALGPREGWIAVRRNRLALGAYSALDGDLAELASVEFVGLVQSRLYDEAAAILAGPAWPLRQSLVARLQGLKDLGPFVKVLHDRGLDDIRVPGVEAPPPHPWQ